MLTTTIIVAFVILFAVVLLSVSVGLKFLESQRKKGVTTMLKNASGEAQPRAQLLKEIQESSNTFLGKLFEGMDLVKKIRAYIKQADLTWSVEGFAVFSLIGMIVGALLGTRLKMIPTTFIAPIVCGLIFSSAPFTYVYMARARRMKALEAQLPDALDFLSRSMRAGHAFAISLQMVGEELPDPMGREFRTLFNEHNLGAPLEAAMKSLCDRIPILDLRFFSSADVSSAIF